MSTKVVNRQDIPLSNTEEELLGEMFNPIQELIIDAELKPEVGNSRILVVHVKNNTTSNYLVVKMAPITLIQQEWDAYQQCIPKKLRGITQIQDAPVFMLEDNLGGLTYPLIGGNEYKTESLLNYCKNNNIENIIKDILEDELFENLQILWGKGRLQSGYNLYENYRYMLPYYLILEEQSITAKQEQDIITVDFNHLSDYTLTIGDCIKLINAKINYIEYQKNELSIKPTAHELGDRILWQAKNNVASYQVDGVIDRPLIGVIKTTRNEQLAARATMISHVPFNPKEPLIRLSNTLSVPNPIIYVEKILKKSINVRSACIHGDLHLENILVEYFQDPETGPNHIAHLIDFDNSRHGHILQDPLQLETDIMTRLLPDLLIEANLPLKIVYSFYKQLHQAVVDGHYYCPHDALQKPFDMLISLRRLVRYYLFIPDEWTEYYYGLVIYLIGTLKYSNLDKSSAAPPKSVAFLGAATTLALLSDSYKDG